MFNTQGIPNECWLVLFPEWGKVFLKKFGHAYERKEMDRIKENLPFKCAFLQIHPLFIPTAWDLIWVLMIYHLVLLNIDWDK